MLSFFRSIKLFFIQLISEYQLERADRNRFTEEYFLQQDEIAAKGFIDTTELAKYRYIKYQYLHSTAWKRKREKVFYRDGYRCIVCNTDKNLEAHHLAMYDAIPNEPISCIITLCRVCHQKEHDLHGYPQTYDDYKKWNVPAPASRTLLKPKFTYNPSHLNRILETTK